MRDIHIKNENAKPFQQALKKQQQRRGADARSRDLGRNARRNVRQMPNRQLQRGR